MKKRTAILSALTLLVACAGPSQTPFPPGPSSSLGCPKLTTTTVNTGCLPPGVLLTSLALTCGSGGLTATMNPAKYPLTVGVTFPDGTTVKGSIAQSVPVPGGCTAGGPGGPITITFGGAYIGVSNIQAPPASVPKTVCITSSHLKLSTFSTTPPTPPGTGTYVAGAMLPSIDDEAADLLSVQYDGTHVPAGKGRCPGWTALP